MTMVNGLGPRSKIVKKSDSFRNIMVNVATAGDGAMGAMDYRVRPGNDGRAVASGPAL